VRLDASFDVDRLLRDWSALGEAAQRTQPGDYHGGGWRGLSLVAPGGLATWAGACLPIGLRPEKTPLLARAPYLEEVLDSLKCTIESARLLTLLPGETIKPHRDHLTCLRAGVARLHVPLITHPDVAFVVGGVRYGLAPGSLWYADFSRFHGVANPTNVPRLHLVVDVIASARLLELFPSTYLRGLGKSDVFLSAAEVAASTLRLPAAAVRFELPTAFRAEMVALRNFARASLAGTRARFGADLAGADEGRTVSFGGGGDGPVLHLDDEPYAALAPLSATTFRMFGFPPTVTCQVKADRIDVFHKDRPIGLCRVIAAKSERRA
jgi:hypothetical protein